MSLDVVNQQNVAVQQVQPPAQQEVRPIRENNFPSALDKDNWKYPMRRVAQEICPGVFLGPYCIATSQSLDYLTERQITHIICVRHSVEARFIKPNFENMERFTYMTLNIADVGSENIIKHFKPVKAFIDAALAANGRVLIHGNAGISRSAALAIAYIMETYQLTYDETIKKMQLIRYCINPNDGFVWQLKEYELIYRAALGCQPGNHHNSNKRSISMVDDSETQNQNRIFKSEPMEE
ncbi:serine/threonine/tyrosine-interacting protein-like [Trichogramma pretiosum]|uniref:serine/threonine/tyrosine-interacting protein-like n=1 Tax=Trichogramma pretiosum TaxID=7493 RepID=UPI0006C94908|nr:serine/threonine/tyrosine-interacting protein-like [Trichogramma pretiosum]